MKNFTKLIGIIALAAVIGFSMAACDDGGGDNPQTATYTGTSGGTTYTLKITENTARYAAQSGDAYELTVGAKKSTGTVSNVSGADLTLKPSNSATTFTATVSGNSLAAMNGTITWTDNTTDPAPETLTGGGGGEETIDTQLVGKWQANSWETLLTEDDNLCKVVGFEYLTPIGGQEEIPLFQLHYRRVNGGGGSYAYYKGSYSLKQNIVYYFNYAGESTPLFSYSISGDTLTLTAINVSAVSANISWRDLDIKDGEVFFTGKKVEKFDWDYPY